MWPMDDFDAPKSTTWSVILPSAINARFSAMYSIGSPYELTELIADEALLFRGSTLRRRVSINLKLRCPSLGIIF